MKLYNCESQEEKELQEIQLMGLSVNEILDLANKIKYQYDDQLLQDEMIVTDALHQISMHLGERIIFEYS